MLRKTSIRFAGPGIDQKENSSLWFAGRSKCIVFGTKIVDPATARSCTTSAEYKSTAAMPRTESNYDPSY